MINNESSQLQVREFSNNIVDTVANPTKNDRQKTNKFFSLKTKATLLAIAIGVIPVASVGLLAYTLLERSLTQAISRQQLQTTEIAANNFTRFMDERIREIEALSEDGTFVNAELSDAATPEEKTAVLNNFKEKLEVYDSIIFFDPQGDPLFQAKSDRPIRENYMNKDYFREAVETETMTINGPGISSRGQLRVEFAAPVRDRATGQLIGILRFRIPGNYINDIFQIYQTQQKHWHLINEEGVIFAGERSQHSGEGSQHLYKPVATVFPGVGELHQAREKGTIESLVTGSHQSESENNGQDEREQDYMDDRRKLVSYVPADAPERFPDLYVGTLLASDSDLVFAPVRQLAWTLFLGTATAAILVAAIAAYLANRATIPLIEAVSTVRKIGHGELDTRLAVNSRDELGELGSNINLMTEKIQTLLEEQRALTEKQRQEKEQLEQAIYTLIDEISDATEGDLTVRANLDSLELSTVADLFNAIIDNLQDIAIEAKKSSSLVGYSLQQNEQEIRKLAEQAASEAKETRDTLKSVAQMSQSIKNVATNASQAEQIADDTYSAVLSSSDNMDSTVDSILNLRTTVNDTANKMQRLAESSQRISQAVSLIEEIALKTNILAINAGAEADRAGEYGRGFSIIAEQVGALAKQSTTAIKEIARVVSKIQAETAEVKQAMESGTSQVVNTTRLVENTKQNLAEVLKKSQIIDQLMRSISQSTVSQAETSQNVTSLMQKIAKLSAITSQSSTELARSIGETAQVAQKLESTVSQFKVADSTVNSEQ